MCRLRVHKEEKAEACRKCSRPDIDKLAVPQVIEPELLSRVKGVGQRQRPKSARGNCLRTEKFQLIEGCIS